MNTVFGLLLAFGLGLLHSFDVDHLCAVASFTTNARNTREAAGLGARWALGHTTVLLVFGGVIVLLECIVPPWFNQVTELAVGGALVAVGVWLIRQTLRARRLHVHWHDHDGQRHLHLHSHAAQNSHQHPHRLTALGMLHGLAGTSGVMVLIPVTLARSAVAAFGYIAAFGLGTVCSMALFAACAGRVFLVLGRWQTAAHYLRGALGMASCYIGLVWIGHNLTSLWR